MKYTECFKTKWHDTDADRRVRPSMLLVYMQETANLQFADAGETLDELRDKSGFAYILSKLRLKFYSPLRALESIKVETWICPPRGFSSTRYFRVICGDKIIAEGDSIWAVINISDKKLIRANSIKVPFEPDAPIEIDAPKHICFPSDIVPITVGQRKIVYSDIDYNMHMNNTRYPDMLCDFMPYDRIEHIKAMTLSYLHEAALGDVLDIYRADKDENYYFKTVNQNGGICLEAQIVCN